MLKLRNHKSWNYAENTNLKPGIFDILENFSSKEAVIELILYSWELMDG